MKPTIKILSKQAVLLFVTALFLGCNAIPHNTYCQRASVKLAKGDSSGALADYNKAIELKPDYVDAYVGRGDTKYKNGDLAGALADYDQATKLKPDLVPIPDLARTPETIVTNEIARQALALLEAKAYNKLDDLAAKFRSSKERYADGVWKLANVYDGLVPSNRALDENWETRLSTIGRWAVARPDSITARVAWANVLVAYAWKSRGAGEADTVSREGWRLFGKRLIAAARVLKDAKALKEQCPLYWRVLMRDALGLQVDKTRFNAIFDEAIKAEPDCESYYYHRAIYLLPQWYGSKGEWQSDLIKSADKIGGENGDMLYARVIWNMHERYDMTPFWEDPQSWMRVDKGFQVIEKHSPDSLAAKIERVHLAILANDAKAAVYYNSGIDKRDKRDWAGAINDYNRAIEIKPDDVLTLYNRAIAKQTKGDLVGALADFNKMIELQPDFAAGYFGRGALKQANRDYDGAIADYTKAIDLKPDFIQELYTARGNLRQYKGDKDGAMADFNQAAKLPKAGK